MVIPYCWNLFSPGSVSTCQKCPSDLLASASCGSPAFGKLGHQPAGGEKVVTTITESNFRHMYWTPRQHLGAALGLGFVILFLSARKFC
jgi:hypothetical protein